MIVDRDAARTALIEVLHVAMMNTDSPGAVLDALLVARQDVPCETCGQNGRVPGQTPAGHPMWVKCPDCNGAKSVPGPLLIDVLLRGNDEHDDIT